MSGSYRAVVRVRPARRLLYALSAACISFGMAGLTLLLTVEHATGSYPDGGFAIACFALAAGISAPARGRLVDRRGARRWLPAFALGYGASLVAIDVGGRLGAPLIVLLVCAAGVGASTPPLFSSARAVWPQAVEPHLVRRGYALTSLLGDVGQVAGPTLAGLLFLVSPWLAPIVCAVTGLLGAALSVPTRDPAHTRAARPMPRLFASRGLLGLLAVSIVFGAAQGIVQVAVPTTAGRWHQGSLAGPLLAAFAFGSVLGALWFGTRRWRRPVFDRYLVAVGALGVLTAPAALATSPQMLAPLLFLAGFAFGPATVSLFETLDEVVPGAGTEALTWVTTAEAGGSASGSGLASVLGAHAGTWAPFLVASAVLVVPTGLALSFRARRA